MANNDNSSSKFTKYDRNRFRKIYPINRFPPSTSFRSSKEVNMESISVAFNGGYQATGNLQGHYKSLPVIMVSPKVPDGLGDAKREKVADQLNVNLFITRMTLTAGKVTFWIEASEKFSGEAAITVVSLT